ncbi:D-aminoacyl-tRNA deacylase [Zoogloea sp.]|uniref:D-aminoacyl-tRNA deacylase n=1 Tax=Zoogloea sp. TaxID=49181 RepID=UPI00261BC3FD|nr:D-aminoacyl-tRNA deacylase [Zoogloea sp.]MDD3354776.1 D-aminoacyl-tRNA deacylase [Zoogloea sp.]
MIAVLQRVLEARVSVDGRTVGKIGPGLLALVAVEKHDQAENIQRMVERVLTYRVFSDENGKMNRSLTDTGGGLLLVSQFTLAADTTKGNRPSFTPAAAPVEAERLFNEMLTLARARHPIVETGQFGAEMTISLINHGPVTIRLTS